jgi:hypothetical protein
MSGSVIKFPSIATLGVNEELARQHIPANYAWDTENIRVHVICSRSGVAQE